MTRKATYQHTTTIQVWPGGQSYTYRGDPEGDTNQRSLRGDARREGTRCFHCHAEIVQGTGDEIAGEWREVGRPHDYAHTRCPQNAPNGINGPHEPQSASFPEKWRKGTPAEWAAIVREVRAARIADREVYCCDSGLVTQLIQATGSGAFLPRPRDGCGELADAFDYDQIRNLYADPSDWDADQCREYIREYASVEDAHDTTDESEGTPALDALREQAREIASENPAEVFEWWRVSEWLCGKLHEIGQVTIDNGLGCWWGRCTTGQGFIMDGVLQRVARTFEEK